MGRKRNLTAIAADFAERDFFISENGTALCGCGCKAEANKGRRFLQGHDRRFIGDMVNAAMVEAEVRIVDGGMMMTTDAKGAAQSLLTERGMAMFNEHLAKAENPAKRPSRAKAPKAEETPADEPTGPQAEDDVRIKVGRWEYDAKVVAVADGEITEVRYTKKDGKTEVFPEKFTVLS